ncbi:MAG TPA: PIN domain-containing protein [Verrucomicrobiales bacterium]|jgi:predicted nucleic acid-binding protein|nr:PIN domain-containing protein [Verrucomicrobiales bacterium]
MAHSDLLWLDSDILLDWLCARQPWDRAATELIERAVSSEWRLVYSPLTLANIFYIYRKLAGTEKALATLGTLSRLGMIADLTAAHVYKALAGKHPDFEDELQIACAGGVPGLTAIVTRNVNDYTHSPVPAMSASDWLASHPLPSAP